MRICELGRCEERNHFHCRARRGFVVVSRSPVDNNQSCSPNLFVKGKQMNRTTYLIVIMLIFAVALTTDAQTECRIDLNKVGQMSDIASNALIRKFHKDESKVSNYLRAAKAKYSTKERLTQGRAFAVAAAKEFEIDEKVFADAIEDYKHVNYRHEGGVAKTETAKTTSNGKISQFAEDVLFHVVVHEIGHGLVREFDLPVLGNEETLADTFATHYIVSRLPAERALRIIKARVASLMFESSEVPRKEWTVQGEHNSDARRAYQIAACAIAYDSDTFGPLAAIVNMDQSDVRSASDYGSEIHRSWRRILKPLWMPEGQESGEARLIIQDDSMFFDALENGKLANEFQEAIKSFDWHSQVKLRFAGGDGGAGWSRSARTVTVHDGYIQRFNAQGKALSKAAD